jgi:hypothetical protein
MATNTGFGALRLKSVNQLQFKIWLWTKHILDTHSGKHGEPVEVCGDSETQYGESEKCIISF